MKLPFRVRQVISYLRADRDAAPKVPTDALMRLTEPMGHQFAILSPGDQRHLLQVFTYLRDHGAHDDTITAGLIHDVGKGCMTCTITVADRAMHVVLMRLLPGIYRQFAALEMPPERLRSLHRLANHPERGALAAKQAGYNDRVCWLVRYHESGGAPDDPQLRLLRTADSSAGAEYDVDKQ